MFTFISTARHNSKKCGCLHLRVNGTQISTSSRANHAKSSSEDQAQIWLNATLQLNKGDEVSVQMIGELSQLSNPKTTYFEGRLIANLEECNE